MIILRGPASVSSIADPDVRSIVEQRFAEIGKGADIGYTNDIGYMIVVEAGAIFFLCLFCHISIHLASNIPANCPSCYLNGKGIKKYVPYEPKIQEVKSSTESRRGDCILNTWQNKQVLTLSAFHATGII